MERQDIIEMLGITESRLDMAVYSGQIPKPIDGKWGENAKIYLDHWLEVIENSRLAKSRIKVSYYPVHQR